MAKNETYNRLIHTTRWLRLRKQVLNANPICQMCEVECRVSAATEVHHIVPCETALSEREMETMMFDPHNVMALCHKHHVEIHTAMGRSGKEARAKRSKERLQKFADKFLNEKAGA